MFDTIDLIVILLAILGLLGVVLEEVIHVNKAQSVLFFGATSWVLLFLSSMDSDMGHAAVITGLEENIGEIASLWLFLISAMTFVVYLNQKGLIETLIYKVLPSRVSERTLLIMTGTFAFLFSSIVDNITATLICVALVLSLNLDRRKTLRFAAVVIFGVNSGGVAMITGDVTTLMIFLEGKVTITELILLSLPAFGAVMVLAVLLARPLNEVAVIQKKSHPLAKVDYVIAIIFALTILSTITGNVMFDIPPVLTFLTGLSIMFLVARAFGQDTEDDPIMNYIRRIEFDTLMFFLGILLLVGALKEIHALDTFVKLYDVLPPWAANYLMGLLSALIDNVPLTAALLKADIHMDLEGWLSLTYAVGVGGSLLVIGSAAGIVAMSKLEDLTFGSYLKYTAPLLIAYSSGFVASLMLARILA
ncbi:sodium:proton antiporter NhaD [Parathalassolituus penaei]|uniref:Sodium:proton antiporter NhaD n=1 Tax=Parathalassolituus penaei TaxID=2997323 RepID=A0A9X3EG11_9GAMM|nr:sodium:proton antiporter NhaD [Parathalassolituus penaei]MCY0966070.1 sodium:proton antiporter NhaD [Parathalassolituus penaei]